MAANALGGLRAAFAGSTDCRTPAARWGYSDGDGDIDIDIDIESGVTERSRGSLLSTDSRLADNGQRECAHPAVRGHTG